MKCLSTSKSYTDTSISAIDFSVLATDLQLADAVTYLESYSQSLVSGIQSLVDISNCKISCNGYTDSTAVSTIATCNGYTNTQISNIDFGNQEIQTEGSVFDQVLGIFVTGVVTVSLAAAKRNLP